MFITYAMLFWVLVSLLITVNPAAETKMAWIHTVMCGVGLLLVARAIWIRRSKFVIPLLLLVPAIVLFGLILYDALVRIR